MVGVGFELFFGVQQQFFGCMYCVMFVGVQFEVFVVWFVVFGLGMGQVVQVQCVGIVVVYQCCIDLCCGVVDVQFVGLVVFVFFVFDGVEDFVVGQCVGWLVGCLVGVFGDDWLVVVVVQVIDDYFLVNLWDCYVFLVGICLVLCDLYLVGIEFIVMFFVILGELDFYLFLFVVMDFFFCWVDYCCDLWIIDMWLRQWCGMLFDVFGYQFGVQVVVYFQRGVGGFFFLVGILGVVMDYLYWLLLGVEVGMWMIFQGKGVVWDQLWVVVVD